MCFQGHVSTELVLPDQNVLKCCYLQPSQGLMLVPKLTFKQNQTEENLDKKGILKRLSVEQLPESQTAEGTSLEIRQFRVRL